MFSLFGLLLGLSIAEIAGGFSRAYDARAERSMGWMAPALAIILLLDLLSFWYGAWAWRDTSLSFVMILTAAVVGLLYYFAATQVFPREGVSTRPSDHFMIGLTSSDPSCSPTWAISFCLGWRASIPTGAGSAHPSCWPSSSSSASQ